MGETDQKVDNSIFLKEVHFYNIAPFEENINLQFKKNEISLITSINGKGKTTILSYVVDAIYEMAKIGFFYEFKEKKEYYYRTSSGLSLIDKNKSGIVYIRFNYNGKNLDYIYILKENNWQSDYENIKIENKVPVNNLEIENKLKYLFIDNKDVSMENSKNIFNENILTYFPAYRGEFPAYLSDKYKNDFKINLSHTQKYNGLLPNKIEIVSNIDELVSWMLDVVLDITLKSAINEEYIESNLDNILVNFINLIFIELLKEKNFSDKTSISIGRRNNQYIRLSIVDKNKQIPNFYLMSSGEQSIVAIFGELIKQVDKIVSKKLKQAIKNKLPINKDDIIFNISNIYGIVLIDEIDKNLHIKLQKEVLPNLMGTFPNIQFIITSHSPFVGVGLEENNETKNRTKIIDLDNLDKGNNIGINNTEIFSQVYDAMKYLFNGMNNKITIYTEGKTDVKYLEKAKENLMSKYKFLKDVRFDCVSGVYGEEGIGGDKELNRLLTISGNFSKNFIAIFLFDRDVEKTIKRVEEKIVSNKEYSYFENKTYAFCLPKRLFINKDYLSIEYYFGKDWIKGEYFDDENIEVKRRLFFADEFNENGISQDSLYEYKNKKGKENLQDKIKRNCVIDNYVYYKETNKLASLTKNEFAKEIVPRFKKWENFEPIFDIIKEIVEDDKAKEKNNNV